LVTCIWLIPEITKSPERLFIVLTPQLSILVFNAIPVFVNLVFIIPEIELSLAIRLTPVCVSLVSRAPETELTLAFVAKSPDMNNVLLPLFWTTKPPAPESVIAPEIELTLVTPQLERQSSANRAGNRIVSSY
jgi:hypothetical protein